MEVKLCDSILKNLLKDGLPIKVFSTDKSTSIRKLLANSYGNIKHNYDPWLY